MVLNDMLLVSSNHVPILLMTLYQPTDGFQTSVHPINFWNSHTFCIEPKFDNVTHTLNAFR